MNVLSLFDGISCGQVALKRVGIKVDKYFASEIDKHAIKVTQHNWPETIQLGDVRRVKPESLPKIDLILAGSPCTGFSLIGKQANFQDERSKLFFEFVRLLGEIRERNPNVLFLLENVKMKKIYENTISELIGVSPIIINSNLFVPQNRPRLYWSNINIPNLPKPKPQTATNIKEVKDGLVAGTVREKNRKRVVKFTQDLLPTLTTHCGSPNGFGRPLWTKEEFVLKKPFDYSKIKRITPIEAERLQGIPDNYTKAISNHQRYKCLGNGWTVDVIAHILSGIPKINENNL